MSDDSDSDYIVEHYVKPDKISVLPVNDESADILGNFDDAKRKKIQSNVEENDDSEYEYIDDEDEESEENEEDVVTDHIPSTKRKTETENGEIVEVKKSKKSKKLDKDGNFSKDLFSSLLRGVSKANRYVLYVTNLNFGTSKERLSEYFSTAGPVKTVRIPKKRKGGFAFVEMEDIAGFQKAFSLHNTTLDERPIKVQLSEAGKKKSANKKNILKQKNRKLAEMRSESKQFSKSGKNFDKSIKKEMEKEKLQKAKMWERRKARRNKNKSKPT